jgi:hypothetical protein
MIERAGYYRGHIVRRCDASQPIPEIGQCAAPKQFIATRSSGKFHMGCSKETRSQIRSAVGVLTADLLPTPRQ